MVVASLYIAKTVTAAVVLLVLYSKMQLQLHVIDQRSVKSTCADYFTSSPSPNHNVETASVSERSLFARRRVNWH